MDNITETKRVAVELAKAVLIALPESFKTKEDVFALYTECLDCVGKKENNNPSFFAGCDLT